VKLAVPPERVALRVVVPSMVRLTLPVGVVVPEVGDTVALIEADWPYTIGLMVVPTVVVVPTLAPPVTVSTYADAVVEPEKFESPL
jgi:hypothetical protein